MNTLNSRTNEFNRFKFTDKLNLKNPNTISLSRHEQVCLMRLRFERYFSHHRASEIFLLKNPTNNIALANLSIYYTWRNIKSEYNNYKFKISAPTWNDEFSLTDGSYSVSDIQEHFEYIIKKT